jgi:hypothetical protein
VITTTRKTASNRILLTASTAELQRVARRRAPTATETTSNPALAVARFAEADLLGPALPLRNSEPL